MRQKNMIKQREYRGLAHNTAAVNIVHESRATGRELISLRGPTLEWTQLAPRWAGFLSNSVYL